MEGNKVVCIDGLHDAVAMGKKQWKLCILSTLNKYWDKSHNDARASPVPMSALLAEEESTL